MIQHHFRSTHGISHRGPFVEGSLILYGAKDRIADLLPGLFILADEIEGIVNGHAFGDHVRHKFDHAFYPALDSSFGFAFDPPLLLTVIPVVDVVLLEAVVQAQHLLDLPAFFIVE